MMTPKAETNGSNTSFAKYRRGKDNIITAKHNGKFCTAVSMATVLAYTLSIRRIFGTLNPTESPIAGKDSAAR